MTIKNKLEDFAGEACKILFPIRVDVFKGNGTKVSICTLSSIDLLLTISNGGLMKYLVIAGRLYSENKGIDQMIDYCVNNPELKYIILCGRDTPGHYPGDALINLIKNGTDACGKILGSISPNPSVSSPVENIIKFKKQVTIVDMRNCFDVGKISETVYLLTC
jgi:tetrahydromethanopterin S-methyltransferase subunit A